MIGGGITGAGVALDAASRGYTVALLEQADYASGTSSRSSKLVHGGLRYLRSFDLGLVREALLERSLMVRLAPHLVRPLPLLVPFFDGRRRDTGTGMGLNLYDVMASERLRRRGRRRAPGRGGLEEPVPEELWSPDRHRVDRRRRGGRAPPGAARSPAELGLPLLRLPDRRRAAGAERARRGRALRRGVRQPMRGRGAVRGRRSPRRGARARQGERRGVRAARGARGERDRRLGRPAAPRRAARRGRDARASARAAACT